jgi:hypothetical protein
VLATATLTASTPSIDAPRAEAAIANYQPSPHRPDRSTRRLHAELSRVHAVAVERARRLGILLPAPDPSRIHRSSGRLRRELGVWRRRAAAYRRTLRRRAPVYRALRCIHRFEGGWSAYSPAGPYYGGLQMSGAFMDRYGADFERRYGDARHWPPALQVAAGYRAVREVGYSPWPSTRLVCGV